MVALGQCLHQCWNVVGWAFRDGLQWNFDQNQHIFIWEDAFENVVGGVADILSWPQCVNTCINQMMYVDEYVWLQEMYCTICCYCT